MMASAAWNGGYYHQTIVTVVVPLPIEVIRRLNQRVGAIEFSKQDIINKIHYSGRMPYGVMPHQMAAMFLQHIIYQEYLPQHKKGVVDACLNLATSFETPILGSLGLYESQVLVRVAGFQLCLIDLQQAVSRHDIFPAYIDALQQVAKRDYTLPTLSTTRVLKTSYTTAVSKSPERKSLASASETNKASLHLPKSATKTKRCSDGSSCPHILSGECGCFHTKQEVAEAGAIVEERVAIPICKVPKLVGEKNHLKEIEQETGAFLSLPEAVVDKTRILNIVGNRIQVDKAVHLLMERAKMCDEDDLKRLGAATTTKDGNGMIEHVFSISEAKRAVLGTDDGTPLKVIAGASATEIWMTSVEGGNESHCCDLHLRGTKVAVDNGIQLLLAWWDAYCKEEETEAIVPMVDSTTASTSLSPVPECEEEHDRDEAPDATGINLDSNLDYNNESLPPTALTMYTNGNGAMNGMETAHVPHDDMCMASLEKSVSLAFLDDHEESLPTPTSQDPFSTASAKSDTVKNEVVPTSRESEAANASPDFTAIDQPVTVDDAAEWPSLNERDPSPPATSESNGVAWDKPSTVNVDDEAAFPSLNSKSGAAKPQAPTTPVLGYATKAAMSPKADSSVNGRKVVPKKKEGSNRSVTKINFKHPCIHGANCQYIQNGRDECKFFHTDHELAQAAARFAEAPIEEKVPIPPAFVGWFIGKGGSHLKKMGRETETNMSFDQRNMKCPEKRVLHISGKRSHVNAAVDKVKKLLSDGYEDGGLPAVSLVELSGDAAVTDIVPYNLPATLNKRTKHTRPKKSKQVERVVYVSPAFVGDVVGMRGKRIMEIERKSGAKVDIAKARHGIDENRRIGIRGKESCVNAALALIKHGLPTEYEFEDGPERAPGATSTAIVPFSKSAPVSKQTVVAATTQEQAATPSRHTESKYDEATVENIFGPGAHDVVQPSGRETPAYFATPSAGFRQPAANPVSPPEPIRHHLPAQQNHHVFNSTNSAPAIPSHTQTLFNDMPVASSSFLTPTTNPSYDAQPAIVSPFSAVEHGANDDRLLMFLKNNASCLKGSPEAFCEWLATEDILTLEDLAEAASDEDYLRVVLQQGNGTVGVKGFRRCVFQAATADAARSFAHDFGSL